MSIIGKISQDPEATTLDDSEYPIVQAGKNLRASQALFDARFQAASANLDVWAGLDPADKQDASDNLTALAGVTPGSAGLAILADATVGDVRDYIGLPVMPEAMASWDAQASAANTADAIEEACAAAVAGNRPVLLSDGVNYIIDQLTIPEGTVFVGTGRIRSDGTLTGSEVTITFGNDVTFESLVISTPGTETNGNFILAGDNFQGSYLELIADESRPGAGLQTTGEGTRIAHFKSTDIDRPLLLMDQARIDAETPGEGSWIGYFEVDGHVRAFRAIYTDRWSIGSARIGRKSDAASVTGGHNAFLMTSCWYWSIGDVIIEDSGEHSIRLGGGDTAKTDTTTIARGCQHWSFGNIRVLAGGGCPFKINSFSNSRSGHGHVTSITGVDIGTGFGNEEICRLSHCDWVFIGEINCEIKDSTYSGSYAVQANDVTHIYIGSINGSPRSLINFDATSDADGVNYLKGPISHFHVGKVPAIVAGASSYAVAFVMDGENISNVYIDGLDTSGFTTGLAFCQTSGGGTVFTGPVRLTGRIAGTVEPAFTNLSSATGNTFVEVDLTYNVGKHTGRPAVMDWASNAIQEFVVTAAFAISDQQATGLYLNNSGLAAGNGNYGAGVEWTRLGGSRRGAAIALKQTGANAQNTGLDFLIGSSSSATDALLVGMSLSHQGNLNVVGALSKGSGTFRIDHPLDPDNKDLVHGFIEGPRYDLIYRGRVTLVDGRATIDLDEAAHMTAGTFDALTQDAEVVSLTNRNGFARLRATEVVGGSFEIICEDENSADEVAWVVMGERADDFIVNRDPFTDESGHLIPEQAKQ